MKQGELGLPVSASSEPTFSLSFEEWWSHYPPRRRVAKKLCRDIWRRKQIAATTLAAMVAKLDAQKLSRQWMKNEGEFIPLTTTYLRQERYDDDLFDDGQPKRIVTPADQRRIEANKAGGATSCPHLPMCPSRRYCTERIVADGRRERGEAP